MLQTRRVRLDMAIYISELVTCSKGCHSTFLKVQCAIDFLSQVTFTVEVNTKCFQQTMHTLLPLKGCIHSPNGGSVIHMGWKYVLVCCVARTKCQTRFILSVA
jgi:hypothetical protein